MAIDFPASPTNGQTFTSGALVYTYDGTKWTAQPAGVTGGTKIEVGNTKAEIVDTGSDGRFVVTTEGTERARIDSSGRLGIGTTGPGAVLHASSTGDGYKLLTDDSTNNRTIGVYTDSTIGKLIAVNNARSAWTSLGIDGVDLRLFTSATERARIDSSGRLLVGTTSTLFNTNPVLHVQGARSAMFKSTSGAGNETITTWNDAASGTIYQVAFRDGAAGDLRGTISTNGSSTAYNTSSDYRLKENVVPLTGAIDRLQQIPVHRFNFIADPDKTVDGFIAHEAQEVVPECVTGEKDAVDDEGNPVYQGIDQAKLVPLLTAALQEAMERIETLEADVAALKAQ
jgi:hypothetical protein